MPRIRSVGCCMWRSEERRVGKEGVGLGRKAHHVEAQALSLCNRPGLFFEVVLGFAFFFQAEDGIRDLYVPGVQTCALPIYQRMKMSLLSTELRRELQSTSTNDLFRQQLARSDATDPLSRLLYVEIGRASCRERGGGAGAEGAPCRSAGAQLV